MAALEKRRIIITGSRRTGEWRASIRIKPSIATKWAEKVYLNTLGGGFPEMQVDSLNHDRGEVGFVSVSRSPRQRRPPIVAGTYLVPPARGRGLGKELYRALAKHIAKTSKYVGISSLAENRNAKSDRLWSSFKEKGRWGVYDVLPGRPYKKKKKR